MANLPKTQAGTVLTAQLWNELINKVNSLETALEQQKKETTTKIAALEKKMGNQPLPKQVVIRSGIVRLNRTGHDPSSPLLKSGEHLSPFIRLNGFSNTPTILYSITKFNAEGKPKLKYRIAIDSATKTQFRVKFNTWGNALIYDIDIKWMAVGY